MARCSVLLVTLMMLVAHHAHGKTRVLRKRQLYNLEEHLDNDLANVLTTHSRELGTDYSHSPPGGGEGKGGKSSKSEGKGGSGKGSKSAKSEGKGGYSAKSSKSAKATSAKETKRSRSQVGTFSFRFGRATSFTSTAN